MKQTIFRSIMATLLLAFVTGIIYPLAITGIAQVLFKSEANGSVINKNGVALGSKLIGQNFSKPQYFHTRPSASGNNGYDASSSSGSNLGPTNAKLIDNIKTNIENILKENPGTKKEEIPVDLVTTSGSGLDPHISPASAYLQVPRIAKTRNLTESVVKQLVAENIEGRQFGIFGEPRVNVLLLNMALDEIK